MNSIIKSICTTVYNGRHNAILFAEVLTMAALIFRYMLNKREISIVLALLSMAFILAFCALELIVKYVHTVNKSKED